MAPPEALPRGGHHGEGRVGRLGPGLRRRPGAPAPTPARGPGRPAGGRRRGAPRRRGAGPAPPRRRRGGRPPPWPTPLRWAAPPAPAARGRRRSRPRPAAPGTGRRRPRPTSRPPTGRRGGRGPATCCPGRRGRRRPAPTCPGPGRRAAAAAAARPPGGPAPGPTWWDGRGRRAAQARRDRPGSTGHVPRSAPLQYRTSVRPCPAEPDYGNYGKEAAGGEGARHAVDGEGEGGPAQRHAEPVGLAPHVGEGPFHLGAEPVGHDVVLPGHPLAVLGPLEVRRRHPAGVGEDVGDDHDAAAPRIGSASVVVGPLAASTTTLGRQHLRDLGGDDATECSRDEHLGRHRVDVPGVDGPGRHRGSRRPCREGDVIGQVARSRPPSFATAPPTSLTATIRMPADDEQERQRAADLAEALDHDPPTGQRACPAARTRPGRLTTTPWRWRPSAPGCRRSTAACPSRPRPGADRWSWRRCPSATPSLARRC